MLVAGRVILAALPAVAAAAHSGVHGQPPAPPPPDNPDAPYDFNPSLAILIIVLVSAFFFVGFFSIYLRECGESNNGGAGASMFQGQKRIGLDAAVLESFPVFFYSQVKEMRIGKGILECAVCLSEFAGDDMLRLIPKCSHVFHPDCIDLWLDSHVTCPVCRAKLSPESSHLKESPPDQYSNSGGPNYSSIEQESGQTQVEIDVGLSIESLEVQNRPPRSRITGKFPRSHSTGHSLVQPGDCAERYTLRLPEDVLKQIDSDSHLKRTMSYQIVLTGEASWMKSNRRGGDGDGEGSSRGRSFWVFSRAAPFVSRTGSVKCEKVGVGGGGEDDGSNSGSGARRVLTAVRGPLACLSGRADPTEESTRPPLV